MRFVRTTTGSAVDVIPHPSGRYDPFLPIKGRHAADGKPVSPVDVRHGQGMLQDPRQMGHVGHLPGAFILVDVPDQFRIGINNPIHPHLSRTGNPVAAIVYFLKMDLLGGAHKILAFRWFCKKSICGVALQLRRCSVPVRTLHSSFFARLASGAFYKTIILVTFYETIKYRK